MSCSLRLGQQFALQCLGTGKYLGADTAGRLTYSQEGPGEQETWDIIVPCSCILRSLDGSRGQLCISLRSCYGLFLCMEPPGHGGHDSRAGGLRLIADRPEAKQWEVFCIEAVSAGPEDHAGLSTQAAIETVLEQIVQRDGLNDGQVMARVRERLAQLDIREAAVAAREAVLTADTAALQAWEAALARREKQLAEDEADREQWHLVE